MTPDLDHATANEFIIATFSLVTGDTHPEGDLAVLFSCGIVDAALRPALAVTAVECGMSIVHLEFEPRREGRGPVNVVVVHLTNGRTAMRTDCALWMPAQGPALIASRDGAASFRHTGVDLVAASIISRKDLNQGFVRARRRLPHVAARARAMMSAGLLAPAQRKTIAETTRRNIIFDPSDAARIGELEIAPFTPQGRPLAFRKPEADLDHMDGEPIFMLDASEEILLRFTSEGEIARQGVTRALCVLRLQPGDLMAFMIWLAERRELWDEWRAYAQLAGDQALAKRINELRSTDGRDGPNGFDILVHDDRLGIDLEATFKTRTVIVASHRFTKVGHAELFIHHYQNADNATLWALFDAACLRESREQARRVASVTERGTVFDEGEGRPSRSPTIQ